MIHSKIAVIYTGDPRTMSSVIDKFVENVLTNENVHVFSVLQTKNCEEIEKILLEKMGVHIKSINWFFKEDFSWNLLQKSNLQNMSIDDNCKQYLLNGGSMIEYFQLYITYNKIEEYENTHGIKYDYILRIRPDTIITRPIDFGFLNMNDETILKRLYNIAENTGESKLYSKQNITIFMNSLIDENRIQNNKITTTNYYENDKYICNLLEEDSDDFAWLINRSENTTISNEMIVNKLKNFIKNGNYVLAFRVNVIYFMNRKHLQNISELGIKYGTYNLTKNDYYWWNAECQFQSICIQNKMHFFNTDAEIESRSICCYMPELYYDNNGDLLNSFVFFFIKRK